MIWKIISDLINTKYYLAQFMQQSKLEQSRRQAAELTIEKALEFAGDNSNYQKKRLLEISIIVVALAVLTCKIAMVDTKLLLIFLITSGVGQIVCSAYLDMLRSALGLVAFTVPALIFFPFSQNITAICFLGMGFFGRGFFAGSLSYINEIGGERFRGWAMIVIFAIWGASYLLTALQWMVRIPAWIWFYALVFIPILVGSWMIAKNWKPSPQSLYAKKKFEDVKIVLAVIAQQNERPSLPFALQGEKDEQGNVEGKKPTLFQVVYDPLLRKITIPLLAIWIYRQYIFYGSFVIFPHLSNQTTKNLILISISQSVAVLMSYPIRLKIRRINAIFGLTIIICATCLASSIGVLNQQCMEKGNSCTMKYIYRISIMLIRFSIALIGSILFNYTLEIYPCNVKNIAFDFFIMASSVGSILFPCLNSAFIYAGYSGFIAFAIASVGALYYVTQLTQTYGRMTVEKLEELQNKIPLVSLKEWNYLAV